MFCTINNENTNKENNEPVWQWAKSGGDIYWDSCKDVAVDKDGNVYVTGIYDTIITFGQFTLNSFGRNDIFVAKLDKYGNWLWAVTAGGESSDEGTGIVVDYNGNVYITGKFWYTASFGNISLTGWGGDDIFAAKLDNNGNWLWAVKAGGAFAETSFGIALDSNGNSYVTGIFRWLMCIGTINLTNPSPYFFDIFVAKIDNDGNWLWATSGGGELDEFVYDIAVDVNGETYITGEFYGNATFGQDNLTGQGNIDVFVAKLDKDGNWLWAISGGGPSSEGGLDIVVDSSCNVYVTGFFWGSLTFETTTLNLFGGGDAYVLKLDTNGNLQWVVGTGIKTTIAGCGIALDKNEQPYIIGDFQGSIIIGASTINSQGYGDIFVAKLDGDGYWQWAVSAGGSGIDAGYSIAFDNDGHIYTTGIFELSATFGEAVLTYEGSRDIFIAKLNFAPSEPKIDGPNKIKPRTSYEYRFLTIDPEDDDISEFIINWGDGKNEIISGPFTSGESVAKNHTWKSNGNYSISAIAKDVNGAKSSLATIEIVVPRSKQLISYELLDMILKRFSNSFPFLRQIINNFL
jgi:hypothetical protein